jgi:hypothetical protein
MYKAVLSGLLGNAQSISDIKGNCSAEACRWDGYTTLAICAAIEDVSSKIEIRNDTKGYASARISGTSWQPPAQSLTGAQDSFWMAAPYKDSANVTDGNLPSTADIFIAYMQRPKKIQGRQLVAGGLHRFELESYEGNPQPLSSNSEIRVQHYYGNYSSQPDEKWKSVNKSQVCLAEPFNVENFCVSESDLQQWSSSFQKSLLHRSMGTSSRPGYPWPNRSTLQSQLGPWLLACGLYTSDQQHCHRHVKCTVNWIHDLVRLHSPRI